jgi:hypothetical protein
MLMKKTIAVGLAVSMIGLGAVAAKASPQLPVRGTITSLSGTTLVVAQASGASVSLTMPAGTKVIEILPSSLADVKAGSYIGTAAIKQPDGVYRAMELQVFPSAMRGVGLGTRTWNSAPHSSMTNGTVGGMQHTGGTVGTVNGSGDLTLTVNDGSGEKTVLVPAGVPVVTYARGSMAELVPGAHVLIFPLTNADGSLTVGRIAVGKDGLTPPM